MRPVPQLATLLLAAWCAACGSKPTAFTLRFAAVADGKEVGCDTGRVGNFGASGLSGFGLGDLRFYVSNLRLIDGVGKTVPHTLDANPFQLDAPEGAVALIDITGNTVGSCAPGAPGATEATARTNFVITGRTHVAEVAALSFDVGVPQALMQATIKNYSEQTAPSPLNEMFWNWNFGYRHFVMNFTVDNGAGGTGGGHLHLGSLGCGPGDGLALADRPTCQFVNTPAVAIPEFDLAADTVAVDLRRALSGLTFVAPILDPNTFQPIGVGPGVACHSSPDQADCIGAFPHFGLDLASGTADASFNDVFRRR